MGIRGTVNVISIWYRDSERIGSGPFWAGADRGRTLTGCGELKPSQIHDFVNNLAGIWSGLNFSSNWTYPNQMSRSQMSNLN